MNNTIYINFKQMNNCIFTTHATLTKEHAEYSLKSLLSNQSENMWGLGTPEDLKHYLENYKNK